MKCNNCDVEMEGAYVIDSDGFNCGTISKIKNGIGTVIIGDLVYCPNCGSIKINILGSEGHGIPKPKTKEQLERESEDRYWDDYASGDGHY